MGFAVAAETEARIDLAACHRIAARYGFHEGIDNHFTLLIPGRDDRFLLAPFGKHWAEIRASDFLIVGLDGQVLEGEGEVEDTAFHIHAPLHRRSGARCILHTHMPYATALSLLEDPKLLMASQNAVGFYDQVGLYDYGGLALDSSEGEKMANALGEARVLLLRNHGLIATGPSVAEAFNTLYFFERAAKTQFLAQSAGLPLRLIDPDILAHTSAQFKASDRVGAHRREDMHFAALKRLLHRTEPDCAT